LNTTPQEDVMPREHRNTQPTIAVGDRFGRLTVAKCIVSSDGRPTRQLECVCDCGTSRTTLACYLVGGKHRSCGCAIPSWFRGQKANKTSTHGMTGTPTYTVWVAIRVRCLNPNDSSYMKYGAKGVTVCERWDSFEAFLSDMGERPSLKHSIDRIDNDRGYEPNNCRWATRTEQTRNRRCTKLYTTSDNITATLFEHAERHGVPYQLAWRRIRNGKTLDEALNPSRTTPSMVAKRLNNSRWGSPL
jgi:hypothetical protein